MSKYIRPDLGKNSLAYRGLRYWLIEIAPDNEFEGWKKSDCDFVLFDCLLGGLVALAKKNEVKTLWSLIKGKTKYKIEENLSWNKRYRSYTEKLKTGNIIMAGEVFREINDISRNKELSFGEQKILENAFKRLVKELSATLKSKEELVHADLKKLLSKDELINL